MDWIDEKLEKLKRWISHADLKKALILYIGIAVVSAALATVLTAQICNSWVRVLLTPYSETELIRGIDQEGHLVFFHQEKAYQALPRSVTLAVIFLEAVGGGSVVVYALAAVIIVARLYYKNKLNPPIRLLLKEAEKIGNNILDYPCHSENGDELGKVCNAVDTMRKQLACHQGKIWEDMEEQRRLNAAFAHDMRTPLTVLHGYVDMLSIYQEKGQLSPEKFQEILDMMDGQIFRLEEFANTMKELHGLKERELQKKDTTLQEVAACLKETVDILNHTQNISLVLEEPQNKDQRIMADISVMIEVADNLISNALRYAVSGIGISLEYENGILSLYVKDDGRGFTGEELKMALRPYYGEEKDSGIHFGIGLSIANTLCEKHGGSLSLSNSIEGGAIVCGTFQCEIL